MSKQKIEIEVDVPDGWEAVAEYRCPHKKEPHLTASGVVVAPYAYSEAMAIPLRRVEPVKESRWLNIHNKDAIGHPRSERCKCDFHEHPDGRAGLIRLDFEDDELVSVALEIVEGKG